MLSLFSDFYSQVIFIGFMKTIEITDIRRITEVVKNQYNYNFGDYALSSFKRRIVRVLDLHKLESVDVLIKKLETDSDYFQEFLSELTVNVTEMFRDPSFWRELRENVIPNLLLNHDKLRVWHAGCSSGEEVFSMCILFEEMGILDNVQIIATDIDEKILARAKEGKYTLKNMDLNNKNYIRFQGQKELADYYTIKDDFAYLNPELVRNVSFREHNLVEGAVFSKFDLVLIRNVMIYFNQTLQNEVLKLLHESMFKYSYLCVGSKESLIWCEIVNKFLLVNSEEKIYKKVKD